MGYGPVKVYMEVENQQPVPDSDAGDDSYASISLKIKNVGQGYVDESKINKGDFVPPEPPSGMQWSGSGSECDFEYASDPSGGDEFIKLVRKESTPVFCKLKAPDVQVEQTYELSTSVKYDYEFRKSIGVQVEPK